MLYSHSPIALAVLSAIITFFFIAPLSHDGMEREDEAFRAYLEEHGYDTSQMGLTAAERKSEVVSDANSAEIMEEKIETA